MVTSTRLKPAIDPQLQQRIRDLRQDCDIAHAPAPELVQSIRDSTFIGTVVPTEYGGLGEDSARANYVVTQLAKSDPSLAIVVFQHFAVCSRIAEWGTEHQKSAILPKLASGEWLAASAWSERGAGANKRNIATLASRRDSSTWSVSGTKSFTTGAGLANIYLVLSQTDASEGAADATEYGSIGQTFFLVPATTAGFQADLSMRLTGMRASATGTLRLSNCELPDSAILGTVGAAPTIISGVRESGMTLGAVALGIAEGAYDLALDSVRRQNRLDDALTRSRLLALAQQIEAAASLVEKVGSPACPRRGDLTLFSKLLASETAESVCTGARHLLGSSAFAEEHPLNILARDARAIALMGPTNELCRDLLGRSWLNHDTDADNV